MPEGHLLEFRGVTKTFGAVRAVDDFTARVEPGRVTGFLGPNGAGKTTSLRILLALVRATSGSATIGGRRYSERATPCRRSAPRSRPPASIRVAPPPATSPSPCRPPGSRADEWTRSWASWGSPTPPVAR